jgi:hypothetical protein
MIVLETVEREDWERLNAVIAECLEEDLETYADDMAALLQQRLPAWPLLQRPDSCARVLHELLLSAQDGFVHSLDVLHHAALFRTLEAALECERDLMAGQTGPEGRTELRRRIEDLETLQEDAFHDHGWVRLEAIALDVLQDGPMCAKLRIDPRAFNLLWPDDIRIAIEEHLQAAAKEPPAAEPT